MKLAISGKMLSGKDFIASLIIIKAKEQGIDLKRHAFADRLKIMAKFLFNIDKKDENGRECLQKLGECGRLANQNYWIDEALKFIKENEHVVFTDVRYKNEAEYLKNKRYILIRVDASEESRKSRGEVSNENHISETDLDNYDGFDFIIKNNYNPQGTDEENLKQLIELRIQIEEIIEKGK